MLRLKCISKRRMLKFSHFEDEKKEAGQYKMQETCNEE